MQYDEMMSANPAQPAAPAGGSSDLYLGNAPNARGGAESFRQRALDLHNELLDLERQYGNAAVIPRAVAARVQHLSSMRDQAINQWQEFDNRAVADSTVTDQSRQSFRQNQATGSLYQQPAAGVANKSLAQQMDDRAAGMKSMAPARPAAPNPQAVQEAYSGGMNPAPAPAMRVPGKVFGDSPDGAPGAYAQMAAQQPKPQAGGTTPQFGHARQKPFVKKPNPGMY